MNWMKLEGGDCLYDCVKRIMHKVASTDVLTQFNRTGTYNKRKFPVSVEDAIKGQQFIFKIVML